MEQSSKEFNLLDKPWIRVMLPDATVKEVSLTDALLCAHQYRGLAGEMPTQDAAILRVLLAVLHAVFTKDINSNQITLESMDDALTLWEELWAGKAFPQEPIMDYLKRWKDRFWLFHPDRPFWQADSAKEGSAFKARKLNGEILESGNKVRFFPVRTGTYSNQLTCSEAARWLIHLNSYDDSSLKRKLNQLPDRPTFKDGWLGRLGFVCALGSNLFETLMLNFVLCDRHEEPWSSAIPVWELDQPDQRDLLLIAVPHDQAALLTLQSRRISLQRENGYVTGYQVLGGEQFDATKAIEAEQMTLWRKRKSKDDKDYYEPRQHDSTKFFWQEFSTLSDIGKDEATIGLVRWHRLIKVPENYVIRYQSVSMKYGATLPHSSVDDVFSDEVSFHWNLLQNVGESWRYRISRIILQCEKLSQCIWQLASQLCSAGGGDPDSAAAAGNRARGEFYFRVDIPFRSWLLTLDAQQSDTVLLKRMEEWNSTVRSITLSLGKELVDAAGPGAYTGRVCALSSDRQAKRQDDRKALITAPMAYNRFKGRVNRMMKEG